ncbi:MAG: diguanylate cyclase [Pontibacterium sp.]
MIDNNTLELEELHWQLSLLQTLDVGLVVVDTDYNVKLWNMFMEHHSGIRSQEIIDASLFDVCADLPENWLKQKLQTVFKLKSPFYLTWEQRPYLFCFNSYRPITGSSKLMYQNVTLMPLTSLSGDVKHIGILVYDVTDNAVGKVKLKAANDRLRVISRQDKLTELYNRGYWEECLVREYDRYRRTGHEATLIMLDIDHFKSVNDSYGHPVGDEVIRQLAALIRHMLRKTDIAGRYGGEEFGIILPNTPAEKAVVLAERLRLAVERLNIEVEGFSIGFTISLGVAEVGHHVADAKAWISRADAALYDSKRDGRNQYTVG